MKAAIVRAPGGPEVLELVDLPVPEASVGEVLIRVGAFGLNRSELFTRQGHSPNVRFPRVLGIEATGTVVSAPGGEFELGQTVATVMGGMGRDFDGGYSEYVKVPVRQVQALRTDLPWEKLGALPEMLQTAWGSLSVSLRLQAGDRLLIRGGTTSVGLAAASIARSLGATVYATTRRADREGLLRAHGAHHVLVDDGSIASRLREVCPEGVDKVLELVGTTTLVDSLACAAQHGVVCMAGMVGDRWTFDQFEPMAAIPTSVALTTYSGGVEEFMQMPLQQLVDDVQAGTLPVRIGRTFRLAEIEEAHRCMETNQAGGKIVILP
ncbi:NADPH:quinone reductase [Aureimonas flava]|uniref:NADPH:quinone reductase n=2 Tax=Aureimonas flava TaxID=2320271 RepID=A0A3A1WI34_9HYPH|nr:NADPH:quinone reductase [Aureimonas flava]